MSSQLLLPDGRAPSIQNADNNDDGIIDDDATGNVGRRSILVSHQVWFKTERIFTLPSSRNALLWLFAIAVTEGIFALISLPIVVLLGLPAWPATWYGYGYTFNVLNWFVWGICVASALFRNAALTHTTTGFTAVQLLVNFIVFALQIVGAFASFINMNSTPNVFGIVASCIFVVLSFVVFIASVHLTNMLRTLQQPRRMFVGSAPAPTASRR